MGRGDALRSWYACSDSITKTAQLVRENLLRHCIKEQGSTFTAWHQLWTYEMLHVGFGMDSLDVTVVHKSTPIGPALWTRLACTNYQSCDVGEWFHTTSSALLIPSVKAQPWGTMYIGRGYYVLSWKVINPCYEARISYVFKLNREFQVVYKRSIIATVLCTNKVFAREE